MPGVLFWLLDNKPVGWLRQSLSIWRVVTRTLCFYSKGDMKLPEPAVMSQRLQDIARISQLYAQREALQDAANVGAARAAGSGTWWRHCGMSNIMLLACSYKCAEASSGDAAYTGLCRSPDLWGVLLTYLTGLAQYVSNQLGAGKQRLGDQHNAGSSSSRSSGSGAQSGTNREVERTGGTNTNAGGSSNTLGGSSTSSSTSGSGSRGKGKAASGNGKGKRGTKALDASSLAELLLPPDHEAVVVVGGRRAVEAQVDAFKEFYAKGRACGCSLKGVKADIGPDAAFALFLSGDAANSFTTSPASSSNTAVCCSGTVSSGGKVSSSSSDTSSSNSNPFCSNIGAVSSSSTIRISSSRGGSSHTCGGSSVSTAGSSSDACTRGDARSSSSNSNPAAAVTCSSPCAIDTQAGTSNSATQGPSSSSNSTRGTTVTGDCSSISASTASTSSSSSSGVIANGINPNHAKDSSSTTCCLEAAVPSYSPFVTAPMLQLVLQLVALVGKCGANGPLMESAVYAVGRVVNAAPLEERHAFVSARGPLLLQVMWLLSEQECEAVVPIHWLDLAESLVFGPG